MALPLLVMFCACIANAQDARISIFERYNQATTYDAIKPLVSGVLAEQYAFVVSHDAQTLPRLIAQQQLTSYRPRIVEIDDATSFLVLENVTPKTGADTSAQAYLLRRSAGSWTLANRLMPDSVLKTLWTTRFTPSQFVQPSHCAIGGKEIAPQSALAVRHGDSIEVSLYPFLFNQADLDYWRQVSGMIVGENAVASSHFNDHKTARCRVVVKIDGSNRLSLLNAGFDDWQGSVSRSRLWQPTKAEVSMVALEQDAIHVITAGTRDDGFRWNVSIRIPIWQRGL